MDKNFWRNLKKPIIALAPMDGYTSSPFRRICREMNSQIVVFTEFTSAEGTSFGAPRILERFRYHPTEQPVIAQIFGSNIPSFIKAAQYLESLGFSGIDINMGCPSKHVVRSEQGVALRKNHDLSFRLIEAVATHTRLPVSVKTRLGWDSAADLTAFGRGVESAGGNLITIHGRTYCEPYGCPADFTPIYELKKNVKIPVIGNGGILSLPDGLQKLGNLDGFMIGQAAWGNPWIFSGRDRIAVSVDEKISVILRHLAYGREMKPDYFALLEMRKHVAAYLRGLPQAVRLRAELMSTSNFDQLEHLLGSIPAVENVKI